MQQALSKLISIHSFNRKYLLIPTVQNKKEWIFRLVKRRFLAPQNCSKNDPSASWCGNSSFWGKAWNQGLPAAKCRPAEVMAGQQLTSSK